MKRSIKTFIIVGMTVLFTLLLVPMRAHASKTSFGSIPVFKTEQEAIESLRDQFINKQFTVQAAFPIEEEDRPRDLQQYARDFFYKKVIGVSSHDMVNDALMIAAYGPFYGEFGFEGTIIENHIVVSYERVRYYLTEAEEKQTNQLIQNILDTFSLDGKSEYEKIKIIYDWVCDHVEFDMSGFQKYSDWESVEAIRHSFTSYGALTKGKAVHRGYAALIYQMMEKSGIDCRIVLGDNEEDWNLVRIGHYYYYLDAAEDVLRKRDGQENGFFLIGEKIYENHHFTKAGFYDSYPMDRKYRVCPTGYGELLPESEKVGPNIEWFYKDGVLSYEGYGPMYDEEWNQSPWDYFYNEIEKVVIAEDITTIGRYAFQGCPNLKEIEMPDKIELIDYQAFHNCQSLSIDKLPKNLKKIAGGAFEKCTGLTRMYFTGDKTEIDYGAFWGCNITAYYPNQNGWIENPPKTQSGIIQWVPLHSVYYDGMNRIAGMNRFETSYQIADALKEELGIEKFDTVILACATGFADALSGSYLANIKNAPILMVNDYDIVNLTAYLSKNLTPNGTIYILGGTAAVSQKAENAVKDNGRVVRLGGANRIETNLLILKEAEVKTEDILLCTAMNFADSLSASAVEKPLLLTAGNSLTASQIECLNNITGDRYILGGEKAVSSNIADQIGEHKRIAGSNRFETSVLIAEEFFEQPKEITIASALNFPDGLCGGPLAYQIGAPLILTANGGESVANQYINQIKCEKVTVFGGAGAVPNHVVAGVFVVK